MNKINQKYTIQPIFSYKNLINAFFSKKSEKDTNFYQSGSAALSSGLKSLTSQKKITNIYIPKFICNEVTEVVRSLELKINYYDIDLNLNMTITDDFKKKLSDKSVILVVNYFGFPADWDLVNKLKKNYDCLVIEDNCHALYSKRNDELLGNLGDISFNSLRKVLPLLSGSVLKSNNSEINLAAGYKITIPSFSEITYSLRGLKNKLSLKNLTIKTNSYKEEYPYIDYFSYKIIKNDMFDGKEIRLLRSRNYEIWHDFLADSDLTFFPTLHLDKNISPYAFPCKANNSKEANKWVDWGRKKNINIIKWPNFPDEILTKDIPRGLHNVLLFPVTEQHLLKKSQLI